MAGISTFLVFSLLSICILLHWYVDLAFIKCDSLCQSGALFKENNLHCFEHPIVYQIFCERCKCHKTNTLRLEK